MTSESWFESWFDSPLYEKLYAHRDDHEAAQLVSWISGQLPPHEYQRVLDLGCGSGRHARFLAQKGYTVTGVDLSEKAIKKARMRTQEQEISGVTFDVGDMRSWRGTPFDMVCSLFTSFGYFDNDNDNLRVIDNMNKNLRGGGCLVMDYLNPNHVRMNLIPEETVDLGEMTCRINRRIENDTIVKSLSFLSAHGKKSMSYQERVKLYPKEWFESVFADQKMSLGMIFGDYSGGRFDPFTSARMVMLVRKQSA